MPAGHTHDVKKKTRKTTKTKPFVKEVKVPKDLIIQVNNIFPRQGLVKGLQIIKGPDPDNWKLLFRAVNEEAKSSAQELISKIYTITGVVTIKQVKSIETTIDLRSIEKVDLKRVFEASSLGEKFGNYNPTFVLKGWYDSDNVFHHVRNCQIHHLPINAVKVTFVLLTENDAEGAVAQNIISKCWLALL